MLVAIGLQIGNVAGLGALNYQLPLKFLVAQMIKIPLKSPYPPMCCYGLVIVLFPTLKKSFWGSCVYDYCNLTN
jgi:hypothetical protein